LKKITNTGKYMPVLPYTSPQQQNGFRRDFENIGWRTITGKEVANKLGLDTKN
jgi:hypothetical protein